MSTIKSFHKKQMKIIIPFLVIMSCFNNGCMQSQDLVIEEKTNTTNVFQLNFENDSIGAYLERSLTNTIGAVDWMDLDDRASIQKDAVHGNVLKVKYPKGNIGSKGSGIQFVKPLPKSDEYYLDYEIKFQDGFEFVLGGKLPGLTSGGSEYTGGTHPDNGEGWSARYMWVKEGEIIVYFYHMDMKKKWGDAIKMNTTFKTGQWYRITQHIKLNKADKFNGIMEVWIDGVKVLNDTDVRYRLAPLGMIDTFYFSTFYGGNTAKWAPPSDNYCYFDNFIVSKKKPKGLE